MVAKILVSAAAIVGMVVLAIPLSTSPVAVGVVFGAATATVTSLVILNLRDVARQRPRRPTQITHQHLHVYQIDAQGKQVQVSEQTRTLTKR